MILHTETFRSTLKSGNTEWDRRTWKRLFWNLFTTIIWKDAGIWSGNGSRKTVLRSDCCGPSEVWARQGLVSIGFSTWWYQQYVEKRQYELQSKQHFEKGRICIQSEQMDQENINEERVFGKISKMHGIDVPMNYIGGYFTYFCFDIEDDPLAPGPYLEKEVPKVWYVRPLQHMNDSEHFSFRYLFNPWHPNAYNYGGLQIFTQQAIIFNPCIPPKLCTTFPFHKVIKRKESFVVIAPRAYNAEFHSGMMWNQQ